VTLLELGFGSLLFALVFWIIRLHAELVVVRHERDDALRQLRALVMVYRKGVDTGRDRR